MKRFVILTMGLAMLAVLAACGKEEEVSTEAELPEPIEVELTVPDHANVNEPVTLSALVTQGDEKVEDANEVEYEIWEEGKKDESILLASTNDKEGIYSAETTFEHDGVFHVQVHVTARTMHVMPEKQIQIGEVKKEEHAEGQDSEAHDHGHTEGLAIHFMQPEDVKAATETVLMTHVQLEGKALEKTNVRYEISDEAKEIQWVEAKESKPGEYTANYNFPKAGAYEVKIHIKDDSLHEHEEHTIEVK
ncbi:FixH family protein [Sporosarcina obsidiansis]|uniref:FixH family protein n=1 Tax=Sporosarcina obsidiansis TaxID=2660748 RepID=UPI00129A98A1|nr:FixH family protein [Sporosarcina obsidiansis]